MDIRAMLTFVASHVEQIFGSTLVLFLVTSVVLLVRSIASKDESSDGHTTVQIDARQIEETIQRALAGHMAAPAAAGVGHGTTQRSALAPVDTHAAPHDPHGSSATVGLEAHGTAAPSDDATVNQLMATIKERDAKIDQLSKEVEKLRNTVTNATAAGASGGDPGVNIDDLKAKLEELQGRLAEYEIIEDDIADLSLFKDENARLKIEIEDLRAQLANLASAAPAVVQQAPAAIPASAPATVAAVAPAPAELKFEKTDKFELDLNDDIMKEFAAAVQIQQAPPPTVASSFDPASAKLPEPAAESAGTSQNDIDAMLASAMDPQLEVDAMLAEAEADAIARGVIPSPRASEPIPEPIAPHPAEAAASAIEAMLASAREQGDLDADLLPMSDANASESDAPLPTIDELLAEAADTDKMLSEVASVESQLADYISPLTPVGSPLEETLDTDKLLAELASEASGGVAPAPATAPPVAAAPVAAAPVAAPVAAPAVAPTVAQTTAPAVAQTTAPAAAKAAAPAGMTGSNVGDDLLAEFKDETRKS